MTETSRCRSCGAEIVWLKTAASGKPMPVDAAPEKRVVIGEHSGLAYVLETYTPHWATCPQAESWRRR